MTNFSQIYDLVTVTIFPGSLESLQGQKIKAIGRSKRGERPTLVHQDEGPQAYTVLHVCQGLGPDYFAKARARNGIFALQ